MTVREQRERDRCHQLMMAALDGEIQEAEKQELLKLLEKYPELRQEFESFEKLKEVSGAMTFKKPDQEVWDTYWYNVYNRIERGLAWIVFTIGLSILIVYGIGEALVGVWRDPNVPALVKIGIFAALFGIVLLIISVIREKLFVRRHERYKEVER